MLLQLTQGSRYLYTSSKAEHSETGDSDVISSSKADVPVGEFTQLVSPKYDGSLREREKRS